LKRGTDVPPVDHAQDARATSKSGHYQTLTEFQGLRILAFVRRQCWKWTAVKWIISPLLTASRLGGGLAKCACVQEWKPNRQRRERYQPAATSEWDCGWFCFIE